VPRGGSLLYVGSFCSVASSVDNLVWMCLFSFAQVSDNLVQVVVMLLNIRVAVAPNFCDYFVSIHFRCPPIAVPGACIFQDKYILRHRIWILQWVFVQRCRYVDNSTLTNSRFYERMPWRYEVHRPVRQQECLLRILDQRQEPLSHQSTRAWECLLMS